MQYFKQYDENYKLNNGKLEYKKGQFFVGDSIINNNRALVNDIVFINNNEVVNIKERFNHKIAGVLYLSSRVKYGYNKRGIPIYKFKPFSNKYPNFHVCSKSKSRKNMYCVISFKDWTIKDKYPNGQIDKYIGETGLLKSEYDYILCQYNLDHKSWKLKNLKTKINNDKTEMENEKVDYNVLSIDPLGCEDIDDAFHFEEYENYYEIGIHIADVVYYLNDEIENELLTRFFTIYNPLSKNNMMPKDYATNICSLLPNKKRRAVSIIFKFNKENMKRDITFKRSIVYNEKAFDYDKVDKIFTKNRYRGNSEKKLLEIKKFLEEKLELNGVNSHNLIEYFYD